MAAFAKATKARPVNTGGPTEMNIPGRVSGRGRPFDISLPM